MVDYKEEAGKYAEGLAEALIGKLGLLLLQEFHLLSRVRDDVVLLRDDAAMMNALLRMYSETDEGAVDHFVREWMTQVRELAYDGEDCMDIFISRVNWAPRSTNPVLGFFHWIATLIPRHRLANDIDALRARAIAISERQARYGVYGQALEPSVAFGARVPMSSTPPVLGGANDDPGQFVGMEAQIKSLSSVLNDDVETLTVCSIVGTGGVGKSTLALRLMQAEDPQKKKGKNIAEDPQQKNKKKLPVDFQCRAVVSVSSQKFDLNRVKGDIHKGFGYAVSPDLTLEGHLKDKRYLIVLDDVWTTSDWEKIRALLPENYKCSRIILTTRIEKLATICSTPGHNGKYIHHANILSDVDSKSLFVTRVFGQPIPNAVQNDDQPIPGVCPMKLKEKMDIILKKCGGLPLAIVCIANVLARYNSPTSIEMWTRVCNSVGSQLETNDPLEGMMRTIALSNNHLPHPLKACAMLLSIFPQGYHIPKWRLTRRWISEGFIPEKRGWTLLGVAEAYYDELLSRNIIQIVVLPDGTVSKGLCRVHDIMHEVIVSKSLEANFVSLEGSPSEGTSSYDPVRRLCINADVGYVADGRSIQHVRSLTTFGNKKNVGVCKLLDGLAKFTLLRVLDLEDCKDLTNKHMKQVCQLFLLRFLGLNETDITKLPSEISKLQQLQSLMLYDTLLKDVPGSVVKLEKLEYLSFRKRGELGGRLGLPHGLKNMKALQHLEELEVGINDVQLATEIGDLVQLRELDVLVPSGHSPAVKTALQKSVAKLRSLSLREENIVFIGDPVVEAE